jgi:3'-phosphoadenosine 5'-phosphosulfate sulfotransferase (PAPS reductase)/FAD synthetase
MSNILEPLIQPRHVLKRDNAGVAHIVGLSGGKDSTCLALALNEREPRPYNYMYTPTGDELPEMEAHMMRLEGLLGPILRITNGTLKSISEDNNMLPSFHARFCTRILKLKPAGDFYRGASPMVAYIGLRADEDEREGMKPGRDAGTLNASDIVQDYPFQRWGWDEDDVWSFLDDRGITIPQRTDCARCPYQKLGEWYNLWNDYPMIYADAEAEEKAFGATFRSPTGKHGPWPHDLKSLRLEFEKGRVPERSLRMMEKRRGMCRACSL